MNKETKQVIENLIHQEKPKDDIQLQMAIQQGYVPPKCELNGGLVMALIHDKMWRKIKDLNK